MTRALPIFILAFMAHGVPFRSANASWESGTIQVLRSNDLVYVRSAFSPERDVVVSLTTGRNRQVDFDRAGLLPKSAPMTWAACAAADLIHACGDDGTPCFVNGTYIGANHGWFGVREIASPQHGLATADLGGAWSDEKGAPWILIKVLDADRLWFMSDNAGSLDRWKFQAALAGALLVRQSDGRKLTLGKQASTQLIPSCRITSRHDLAEGKTPLRDGEAVSCSRFDVIEEYDIVNPAAVLEAVKRAPGREVNFVDPALPALITQRIRYRFQPMGTCLVDHRTTAHVALSLGSMGFIQTRTLVRRSEDGLRYLIPGTIPFTLQGTTYDFRAGQDFSERLKTPLHFGAAQGNLASADRLPSRFIQLLQRREKGAEADAVGYAFGYSLTKGMTRPDARRANCETALMIHTSNKSYPHALDQKKGAISPGETFEARAYRQYFAPRALSANAACAYWHQEDDDVIVCVDYLQPVERDLLRLPEFLADRRVTVLESTPSVTVISGATVPKSGLVLSVKDAYGSAVLKLSPPNPS